MEGVCPQHHWRTLCFPPLYTGRNWGKASCRSTPCIPEGALSMANTWDACSQESNPCSKAGSQQGGATPQQPQFQRLIPPLPEGCEHQDSLSGNTLSCCKGISRCGSALPQSTPAALASPALLRCSQRVHSSLPGVGYSHQDIGQDWHCHCHPRFSLCFTEIPCRLCSTRFSPRG